MKRLTAVQCVDSCVYTLSAPLSVYFALKHTSPTAPPRCLTVPMGKVLTHEVCVSLREEAACPLFCLHSTDIKPKNYISSATLH